MAVVLVLIEMSMSLPTPVASLSRAVPLASAVYALAWLLIPGGIRTLVELANEVMAAVSRRTGPAA